MKIMRKFVLIPILLIFTLFLQVIAFKYDGTVHVFYCADDGNEFPTRVSIASLLDNSGDEKISIHIVSFSDNKMSAKNIDKILSLKESIKDFDLDFTYFDKSRLDEFNTEGWNKAIMVKLYAAELFPYLDRIIWLDDDTIILKSLKELYVRDELEGKYLAAVDVSDEFNNYDIKNKKTWRHLDRWITAAIGLYNIEEIKKNGDIFLENLLKSAKDYDTKGRNWKRCHSGGGIEEYALTYGIPKNKILTLLYRYSVNAFLYNKSQKKSCKLDEFVTLHFSGYEKPWRVPNRRVINDEFLKKWDYYCNLINLKSSD